MLPNLLKGLDVNFQALRPRCRTNVRLSDHTSLGVGGEADIFFAPQSVRELREELLWLRAEGIPLRVLGAGTNAACRDRDLKGAVVSTQKFSSAYHEGLRIRARAGCSLVALVKTCRDAGLSGMAPLAGIPGSVGGAVVMNAGGRYGCIGPLVEEVRTLTLEGEERVHWMPADRFSYRRGDFGDEIVTEVVLGLASSDRERVRKRMRTILVEKLATQPLSERSAGCVFRNPPGDSAGRLIDACGLKGTAVGGMRISTIHANFIVNGARGSFREFMELAELARARVKGSFGTELEFEVTIF